MKYNQNIRYRKIVETAKNLFIRYGIRRVNIQEICKESNVSKMTFYKIFRNKNDLILSLTNHIMTESEKKYNGILEQDIPFRVKVALIIHHNMEQNERLTRELLNDIYQNGELEVIEFIRQRNQKNIQTIMNDFLRAQQNGQIRLNIKCEFISFLTFVLV